MTTTTHTCTINLPSGFRTSDVLAFHQRDEHGVAERVAGSTLHKGLVWGCHPARLSVRFSGRHALAELAVDGAASADEAGVRALARRMLGLTQPVEDFEHAYRDHEQIGPLVVARPALRVPLAATPFEALTWAIIGQQISVRAAVAVRRRLVQAGGLQHSGGLYCYPDAHRVAALSETELRQAGLSRAKANTVTALSDSVVCGDVPLDAWAAAPPVEEIRATLLALRGIGHWTVEYALLRGFGWLDGSLHGDVAVRRKIQTLLASPEKISADYARDWLAAFSPWRALVAAHLWAAPLTSPPAR